MLKINMIYRAYRVPYEWVPQAERPREQPIERIDPARVIRRLRYAHPVYTTASEAARARRAEIQGRRRTWYCGAYWRYGFHEDGVVSALDVTREFGVEP